jgi:uncharacterized SAM-binding protein YcdF (DUF218 family)
LAARTGLPLAVSGGSPNGGALGEALLMKNLLENGFRQRVTLVEDKSFDTRQNALYIAKALAGSKVRTVVLVTDVTHMPRAARAFARFDQALVVAEGKSGAGSLPELDVL